MSKLIAKSANSWVRCKLLHTSVGYWQTVHYLWDRHRIPDQQHGFTLLEVIVAMAIVGLLLAPLLHMFVDGTRATENARIRVAALYDTQQIMESVKGMDCYRVGNPRSSSDFSITLASNTGAVNLAGELVTITAGKGKGQVRRIVSYDSVTQVASIDDTLPWDDKKKPDATSTYLICSNGFMGVGVVRECLSQAITLAEENTSDNLYNGYYVTIAGGTGSGQTRRITDYNGTSIPQATAFLDREWNIVPDNFSLYKLYQFDYEIRSVAGGYGLQTVSVTVFYKNGTETQAVSLTTDRPNRD